MTTSFLWAISFHCAMISPSKLVLRSWTSETEVKTYPEFVNSGKTIIWAPCEIASAIP